MKIAYLMNSYPMTSTTFIGREIAALERLGFSVMRIALRRWNENLVDLEDQVESTRTQYVLHDGAATLLSSTLWMAIARPARFASAFALTWRLSQLSERPLLIHLVYLAEACRIEPWLRAVNVKHLHAHFGTNSAEVAMLVHALGGPPWSFTVHGPEDFDKAPLLHLADKARHAAFVVAVSSFGRSQIFRLLEKGPMGQGSRGSLWRGA